MIKIFLDYSKVSNTSFSPEKWKAKFVRPCETSASLVPRLIIGQKLSNWNKYQETMCHSYVGSSILDSLDLFVSSKVNTVKRICNWITVWFMHHVWPKLKHRVNSLCKIYWQQVKCVDFVLKVLLLLTTVWLELKKKFQKRFQKKMRKSWVCNDKVKSTLVLKLLKGIVWNSIFKKYIH